MTTLELQKMAVEVRKGIVTAVSTVQRPDIRADLYPQQMSLPISILRR